MIKIIKNNYKITSKDYIEKLNPILKKLNLNGLIVIKLGDKEESRKLNKKFRNKDYPTDVLSFPVNEDFPEGFYIGDIHICYPIAKEQARENKHKIFNELLTLIIHGILHLSGYDHEKDNGEMLKLQDELLKEINA